MGKTSPVAMVTAASGSISRRVAVRMRPHYISTAAGPSAPVLQRWSFSAGLSVSVFRCRSFIGPGLRGASPLPPFDGLERPDAARHFRQAVADVRAHRGIGFGQHSLVVSTATH